jgi:hypothetical protein
VDAPKAHIVNGRIVVDDPIDLPESVELKVYLCEEGHDQMTDEERNRLHRALELSIAQADAGELIDADEVLAELDHPL